MYIVVPAYNESENVSQLVEKWYPVVERHDDGGLSRLIVIDDGSEDDTYERLQALAADRPLLVALTKTNSGHGPTLIYGYRHALGVGADWVFQTDSDGQTDPSEFDLMWDARADYDAQFGNRTERGDGRGRAFAERTLCRVLRHYFGVCIPDANAPFRLMSAQYLADYLPRLPEDYNLPMLCFPPTACTTGGALGLCP